MERNRSTRQRAGTSPRLMVAGIQVFLSYLPDASQYEVPESPPHLTQRCPTTLYATDWRELIGVASENDPNRWIKMRDESVHGWKVNHARLIDDEDMLWAIQRGLYRLLSKQPGNGHGEESDALVQPHCRSARQGNRMNFISQ